MVVLNSEHTDHGLVYYNIIECLEILKSYIHMDSSKEGPPQHLKRIRMVIRKLKLLLSGKRPTDNMFLNTNLDQETEEKEDENKNDDSNNLEDSSIFCRIFKSLNAGDLMVDVLKSLLNIPAKHYHEYIDTLQVCLELLCVVTRNDEEFQV